MKHDHAFTTDEVEAIRDAEPKRSSFPDWYAWMEARGYWAMDLFHAIERRDRRARFPRTFA